MGQLVPDLRRRYRESQRVQPVYTRSGRRRVFRAGPGDDDEVGQSNDILPAMPCERRHTTSLELASIGVTVNAIGPGAVTRLSAGTARATPKEADEYGDDDDYEPLNPAVSSPVVAWLAIDVARGHKHKTDSKGALATVAHQPLGRPHPPGNAQQRR